MPQEIIPPDAEELGNNDQGNEDAILAAESESVEFSSDEDSDEITQDQLVDFNQAVLWGTDWTVETIIAQMRRGNIEINPQFQRRDAWSKGAKSSFIESLIMGLPIPQVVLAERPEQRGTFLILDGKQRLLSIMQFAGLAEQSANNNFALSGLTVRRDLRRKRFTQLENRPELLPDLNAFLSHTIRAVIIRNWPSMAFLHVVFHRLNSGSLKLSAQELRLAMVPGDFTNFADEFALGAQPIHRLLQRSSADPRMRDTELLVRYLALKHFLPAYTGRMKEFLDQSCTTFNSEWGAREQEIREGSETFLEVILILEQIFGDDGIARKEGSSLFNRSIFDVLARFATDSAVRATMIANPEAVRAAYAVSVANHGFQEAVDSDTAGIPHTAQRIEILGQALTQHLNIPIQIPGVEPNAQGQLRFVA